MNRPRFLPDNFTLTLVAVVTTASILPCSGIGATFFDGLTTAAIALLFFMHGAKLSREAVVAGITHWRLHLVVVASTFVLFPLLGWALKPVLSPLVTPQIYSGLMYLCVLPATVQSAIAFASMARGNIPAAVCSASASTMLGVFITPVLVNLFVVPQAGGAGDSLHAVGKIILQLMVPFIAGQLARPLVGKFMQRHAKTLKMVDQSSILLVIYTAFSAAVIEGLWKQVPVTVLLGLLVACCVLLAVVLVCTTMLSRKLGFSKEDEITIVFCGSKKSLASGVPMAKVLFSPETVGVMVLPLMLFHQVQLMVCAVMARRYAAGTDPDAQAEAVKA